MNLREYLLDKKVYFDQSGSVVCFSNCGLYSEPADDEFWIFIDEGTRCGGLARQIPCDLEMIEKILLGIRKDELWEKIRVDVLENFNEIK